MFREKAGSLPRDFLEIKCNIVYGLSDTLGELTLQNDGPLTAFAHRSMPYESILGRMAANSKRSHNGGTGVAAASSAQADSSRARSEPRIGLPAFFILSGEQS